MALNTCISDDFAAMLRSLPRLDADALIAALDTEPCVSIRLNRHKFPVDSNGTPIADAGYTGATPVGWCADGRYLTERPNFTLNPLLHAGAFYVQDASSMIHQQLTGRLSELLGDKPLSLLDFCAAPGGKTTAMINALPRGSVVTANEYSPSRGKILRENLEKWGYPAVITTGASADEFARLPEIFDIIAVDAPCSGEGMMRKEEEARRQWSPALVDRCAELQRDILRNIVTTLRPGGYLIYSTCTFNLEEDELNAAFIRDELMLEPVDPATLGLEGIQGLSGPLLPDVRGLRFMQHLNSGEGLFVSIFHRPGKASTYFDSPSSLRPKEIFSPTADVGSTRHERSAKKGKRNSAGSDITIDAPSAGILRNWIDPQWEMAFERSGNIMTAIPANASPILAALRKENIRVTGAGLPIAEFKGRDLIPDSRIVLSEAFNAKAFPTLTLTLEESLRYLRREAIQLPPDTPEGFVTVTYAGLPLGIMKNLGNRANNLFPAPWRIRI